MNRKACIILHAVLVLFNSVLAQNEWKTHTATQDIRLLCSSAGHIWCGTEGGLLAFQPESHSFKTWTNTEGLISNEITAIATGSDSRIWIGMKNGFIQTYDPVISEFKSIDDFRGHSISTLNLKGDTLIVGLDIGVSIFLLSKNEVKETYRHLGKDFQVEIPVQNIQLLNGDIWIGTAQGIARSQLNFRNLLDPENWTNYTVAHGLPDNSVVSLTVFGGLIYAATPGGIAVWSGSDWSILSDQNCVDIVSDQDRLITATQSDILTWDGEQWTKIGTDFQDIHKLFVAFNSIWCATSSGLAYQIIGEEEWNYVTSGGMGSNVISDIAVDASGKIWATSRDKGFFVFDGNNWTIFDSNVLSEMKTNDVYTICIDSLNNKWIGTWGKGIVMIRSDSSFVYFNAENGFLSGILADENYAVVSDIATTSSGDIWLLNREAMDDQPLVSVTPNLDWTYYGSREGISTNYVTVLSVDINDHIWVGTENNGVYIVDDQGTPDNPNDDPSVIRLTTSDGLESSEITALAGDRDGGIWIGTPKGLYQYSLGTLQRQYGLPSDHITSLAVDGANNIWIGTDLGVSLFMLNSYSWQHFNEDNSKLVNNEVTALYFDMNTGFLYIGTSKGLSCLSTPYSKPNEVLQPLHLYPNPYFPDNHGYLSIDQLSANVSLSIFTSSGYLIRKYPPEKVFGRQIIWDGRDQNGKIVPAGIYIIVVQTEDGEYRTEKLAIIR